MFDFEYEPDIVKSSYNNVLMRGKSGYGPQTIYLLEKEGMSYFTFMYIVRMFVFTCNCGADQLSAYNNDNYEDKDPYFLHHDCICNIYSDIKIY